MQNSFYLEADGNTLKMKEEFPDYAHTHFNDDLHGKYAGKEIIKFV